jgi:hypothetical protein
MPFEKHGTEALDAVVNVRMTVSEKARLKEEAEIAGLTVSQLVRRRSLGRRVVAATDAAMIRELRRLGGLLKHIHTETGGTYSTDTAQALAAIREAIERLSHDR